MATLRMVHGLRARLARGFGGGIALPDSSETIGSLVNRLAWPVILENLFQTLLGVVDMLMVSRLGSDAIAGVGTATQVMFVVNATFAAITVGTTVLVARFTGAGQPDEANRVAKQSLLLGVMISAVVMLLGHFSAEPVVRLMGAEPQVVTLGGGYLRIVSQTAIFLVTMFVAGGALRGAGDTRTPMLVTGFINLVNAVASYVLIFGHLGLPALGVDGSAWGAGVARAAGTAIMLVVLLRGRRRVSIAGREGWGFHPDLIQRVLRLGIPSMFEQLLLSGGMLLYSVITISLGTTVYATQRITFNALSISFLPGFGFAMAATALTGQSLGAKQPDVAERATWYAVRVAAIWMSSMGLMLILAGQPIMRLFSQDPEIVVLGAAALRVIALSQPFQAFGQVLAGGLRGAGDTRFPMGVTFAGIWLVRLPLGYLMGPLLGYGLPGVYVSNVLDAFVRAGACFLRYRTGRWRQIEV
jgi:MATE family multidrug resistance protein